MTNPDMRFVAFHEAGHAVAHWVLYQRAPQRITIEPEAADEGGYVESKSPRWFLEEAVGGCVLFPTARMLDRVQREIIELLAGEIAQRRFAPNSVEHIHGRSDRLQVVQLAELICGSDEERFAFERWLRIRAEGLMERHWELVEAVADVLLKRGTLLSRHFRAIVRGA
jgi:hypothetical protein